MIEEENICLCKEILWLNVLDVVINLRIVKMYEEGFDLFFDIFICYEVLLYLVVIWVVYWESICNLLSFE